MKKEVEDAIGEKRPKLAVVVGHSFKKKGAYSKHLKMSEYSYNSSVALAMKGLADELKLEIKIFWRDDVGIRGVYSAVNKWIGKDLGCSIELHFNAASGRARGSETLYDIDPADSYDLAREVQEAMVIAFGRNPKQDRGVKRVFKGDRGYFNLEQAKCPAVIVEPFFGDNSEDAKLGEEKLNDYAGQLLFAVKKFFRNA